MTTTVPMKNSATPASRRSLKAMRATSLAVLAPAGIFAAASCASMRRACDRNPSLGSPDQTLVAPAVIVTMEIQTSGAMVIQA